MDEDLSLYVRAFINAAPTDAYSAVSARLGFLQKLSEDLSVYMQERGAIEDQYAKSLAKLEERARTSGAFSKHGALERQAELSDEDRAIVRGWSNVFESLKEELKLSVVGHERFARKINDGLSRSMRKRLSGPDWAAFRRVETELGDAIKDFKSNPRSEAIVGNELPVYESQGEALEVSHVGYMKEALVRFGTFVSDISKSKGENSEKIIFAITNLDQSADAAAWALREEQRSGQRPPGGDIFGVGSHAAASTGILTALTGKHDKHDKKAPVEPPQPIPAPQPDDRSIASSTKQSGPLNKLSSIMRWDKGDKSANGAAKKSAGPVGQSHPNGSTPSIAGAAPPGPDSPSTRSLESASASPNEKKRGGSKRDSSAFTGVGGLFRRVSKKNHSTPAPQQQQHTPALASHNEEDDDLLDAGIEPTPAPTANTGTANAGTANTGNEAQASAAPQPTAAAAATATSKPAESAPTVGTPQLGAPFDEAFGGSFQPSESSVPPTNPYAASSETEPVATTAFTPAQPGAPPRDMPQTAPHASSEEENKKVMSEVQSTLLKQAPPARPSSRAQRAAVSRQGTGNSASAPASAPPNGESQSHTGVLGALGAGAAVVAGGAGAAVSQLPGFFNIGRDSSASSTHDHNTSVSPQDKDLPQEPFAATNETPHPTAIPELDENAAQPEHPASLAPHLTGLSGDAFGHMSDIPEAQQAKRCAAPPPPHADSNGFPDFKPASEAGDSDAVPKADTVPAGTAATGAVPTHSTLPTDAVPSNSATADTAPTDTAPTKETAASTVPTHTTEKPAASATHIPLKASFKETVNVLLSGGKVDKILVAGELDLTPESAASALFSDPVTLTLPGLKSHVAKIAANSHFLSGTDDTSYTVSPSIVQGSGPQPVLKYQVAVDPESALRYLPLLLSAQTKIEPKQTSQLLNVTTNPQSSVNTTPANVSVSLPVLSSIATFQSKPQASWNASTNTLDFALGPVAEPQTLLARIFAADGHLHDPSSTPQYPVALAWTLPGASFTRVTPAINSVPLEASYEIVSGTYVIVP